VADRRRQQRTRKRLTRVAPGLDGLVAIEGVHGPDVAAAATILSHALQARQVRCGISRWDASGLFGDVASAPANIRDVSPRTLLLLYAADLAFRLRWEIAPALESGLVVIAAPYVATATAFGLAAGLPAAWLSTLFRFAPTPTRVAVLRERKSAMVWKRRPDRGFGECCTVVLETARAGFARKKTRSAMYGALSATARHHGGLVRKKEISLLAEHLTARPGSR
jgi:thymidylate kinase